MREGAKNGQRKKGEEAGESERALLTRASRSHARPQKGACSQAMQCMEKE